jgi:cell division protein ZapE
LIDILYEKNIPLLASSKSKLNSISSSINLRDVFKRTISRLHELTSIRFN